MMPWKLLAFILAMTIVLVFIGFNLENRCDVSFVFHTFADVPVVITILASFLLGLLMAFPLSFVRKSGKQAGRDKPGSGNHRNSFSDVQGPSFGAKTPAPRKSGYKGGKTEDSVDPD
jgi:uncharacterized integral membrane protein